MGLWFLDRANSLIQCKIDNGYVPMQLDSGAACSILPEHTALSLRLPIQPTNKCLCTYDGKQLTVIAQTLVSLEFDYKCWRQLFIIVRTPHNFGLLG